MSATRVLIDHLRGRRRLRADVQQLGVSVVTRCELFAGRDERERLHRFLWPMIELPIDATVADWRGSRDGARGSPLPTRLSPPRPLQHRISLMTRNQRYFDGVEELRIVTPG